MVFKIALFLALLLPLAGLAVAVSEPPPNLQISSDQPKAEITLNLPIWIQLLSPLITLLGLLGGASWFIGKLQQYMVNVDEKFADHLSDITKLWDSKVSKEFCDERHRRSAVDHP